MGSSTKGRNGRGARLCTFSKGMAGGIERSPGHRHDKRGEYRAYEVPPGAQTGGSKGEDARCAAISVSVQPTRTPSQWRKLSGAPKARGAPEIGCPSRLRPGRITCSEPC